MDPRNKRTDCRNIFFLTLFQASSTHLATQKASLPKPSITNNLSPASTPANLPVLKRRKTNRTAPRDNHEGPMVPVVDTSESKVRVQKQPSRCCFLVACRYAMLRNDHAETLERNESWISKLLLRKQHGRISFSPL